MGPLVRFYFLFCQVGGKDHFLLSEHSWEQLFGGSHLFTSSPSQVVGSMNSPLLCLCHYTHLELSQSSLCLLPFITFCRLLPVSKIRCLDFICFSFHEVFFLHCFLYPSLWIESIRDFLVVSREYYNIWKILIGKLTNNLQNT